MRKRTDAPMTQALAWFHDPGLEPDQPTEHQLKFGEVNFYPPKGTMFVDGEIARRDETGFDALAALFWNYPVWRAPFSRARYFE